MLPFDLKISRKPDDALNAILRILYCKKGYSLSLGPYIQVVTNYKMWFDASVVALLIQAAPDLHEYGLQGGAGLMTRSHAADKINAYADVWCWFGVRLFIYTPLFTLYPTLNQQCFKVEDSRKYANGN